jgi:hypothetical protein
MMRLEEETLKGIKAERINIGNIEIESLRAIDVGVINILKADVEI